jgi:hypothetical protein
VIVDPRFAVQKAAVESYFNEPPAPSLHHYTTQSGLLGILRTDQLWASHHQYLNDRREYRHALDILNDEFDRLTKADKSLGIPLAMMREVAKRTQTVNVCVACFSERGDALSQWRAYGGAGASVAIEFAGSYLRSVSLREGYWLGRCIYKEREQRKAIQSLVEWVVASTRAPGSKWTISAAHRLTRHLARFAPLIKDGSFAEEQEWRLISKPLLVTHRLYDFRAGNSMLVPYVKIPLRKRGEPLQIEGVTVGPTPNGTAAKRAVQGLLAKHGLAAARVSSTKTPYRSW